MRVLIGSLLLVVLAAIVGVGWTLDQLFDRVSNDNISDDVQIYQEMGAKVAAVLDATANPQEALERDVDTNFLRMSLQKSENFALPLDMQVAFETGEALVLDSDEGVSLHYYLPVHGEVLTINPSNYNAGSQSVTKLIFTAAFYLFVLTLLLLWLYPLIRRLTRLSSAAREFGSGKLDRRVDTDGVSYIADIEVEFNRMAERIQTLISDNKLLSSAVSHDLRTPLARLRFGIDTLEDTRDPEAKRKYTQRLSADISEMENLVSSLLDFARLDYVLQEKYSEVLPIERLITQCVELHRHEDISITLNMQGEHQLRGHENHFTMLLGNLVQNALKFARHTVHIELSRTAKGTRLVVSDDGPGIPPQQYRTVLMPFTRGENNSTEKGHGLGLAIVNRIAQRYDGSVEIDSCPVLQGARISIVFE
ncbi:MAG: ATP-binding protein [Granulosicoccus sp.]